MHVALLNVNEPLFTAPLGDDVFVLKELGERVEQLTVVVATAQPREPVQLAERVRLVPAHAPDRLRGLRAMAAALRRVHAQRPVDLIQAQEAMYTGAAAWLANRAIGAKLTVCVFGADPGDPGFRASGRAQRVAALVGSRVLRGADAVQTDSRETEEQLRRRGITARYKPITPLNLDVFAAVFDQREHRDPARRILFVGRLANQKRLGLLLESVAELDAQLVLVGDGPERPALERRAGELGVAAEFRGQVPHEALRTAYLEADVLAASSYFEGMPRAFMEAAATGLPIVSTPVAGALELQRDAPIWVAPPEGLSGALAAALADADARRRCGDALHALMARRITDTPPPDQQVAIWRDLCGPTLAADAG
jgi:glycosyltransferase involved in cell wall biosynthesis